MMKLLDKSCSPSYMMMQDIIRGDMAKTKHFPLLAEYRDCSLLKVARLSEQEAYELCLAVRWEGGVPKCPKKDCGAEAWVLGDHSATGDKRQFKCTTCRSKFSVTSGTLLHARKLDFSRIVCAAKMFSMAAKGTPSLLMGNECEMNVKTGWVLGHKMREGQIRNQLGRQLHGDVEIDGSTYGGHIQQVNEKAEWIDRRRLGNVTGKEMSVVVARERSTKDRVGLSVCTVVPHESEGRPFVLESVDRFATVHADDGSHWDALRAGLHVRQVNHKQRFYDKGTCTNQAESYFSRLDRMEMGTHHHIAGDYLWGYACDAVWREDVRRKKQSDRFLSILSGLLNNPTSRTLCGYWQRHLPTSDSDDVQDAVTIEDVIGQIEENAEAIDGGMDEDAVAALFGIELPAERRHRSSDGWKRRMPFVARRHKPGPAPWSELQQHASLPSLIP